MKLPILFASAMLLVGGPAFAHKGHKYHTSHTHHPMPVMPSHRHYHCHSKKSYCHFHRHSHGGPGYGHHGKRFMHKRYNDKNWYYDGPTFELHIN